MDFAKTFIHYFNYICFTYTIILGFIYILQLLLSYLKVRKTFEKQPAEDFRRYDKSENVLPMSVIIPAYNEDVTIVKSVREMLKSNYPSFEVIVVNDGSTDNTHKIMCDSFQLKPVRFPLRRLLSTRAIKGIYKSDVSPNLLYVDKFNGGKADALNAGINVSKFPLFVCVDADSQVDKNALLIMASEFMKDTTTVAAGGFVRLMNGSALENGVCKSFTLPSKNIEKFQIVEYFRAFLGGRISWGIINSMLVVSGAFGVFNKQAVIEAGGYKTGTVGEDMEIIIRLHQFMMEKKREYSIRLCENATCWTQGPDNLSDLRKQRRRWQIGLIDSLNLHRKMFLNPSFGAKGMIAVPYAWFFEYYGTVIEALGYFLIPIALIVKELSIEFFIIYLLLSVGLGVVISLGGLILDQIDDNKCMSSQQIFRLAKYAFLENLGYRQFVTLCRAEGILRYRKFRTQWGKFERRKFGE